MSAINISTQYSYISAINNPFIGKINNSTRHSGYGSVIFCDWKEDIKKSKKTNTQVVKSLALEVCSML
jgi:hypothetical protein